MRRAEARGLRRQPVAREDAAVDARMEGFTRPLITSGERCRFRRFYRDPVAFKVCFRTPVDTGHASRDERLGESNETGLVETERMAARIGMGGNLSELICSSAK
jgi:hypothetical protein